MIFHNKIKHVAIIMDGNARWAKKQRLSIKDGYKKGLDKLKEIIDLCCDYKIKYLTVYALSSENIKRKNVKIIFEIIEKNVEVLIDDLVKEKKAKIKIFGKTNNLPIKVKNIFNKIEKITKKNNYLNLNIAFNYGFIDELINSINKITNLKKTKDIIINEKLIRDNLYLPDVPDPDILIRTGGYQRLSNFLLFQLSYSELFFLDTLWPDLTKDDVITIFKKYKKIERKYGL